VPAIVLLAARGVTALRKMSKAARLLVRPCSTVACNLEVGVREDAPRCLINVSPLEIAPAALARLPIANGVALATEAYVDLRSCNAPPGKPRPLRPVIASRSLLASVTKVAALVKRTPLVLARGVRASRHSAQPRRSAMAAV